MRIVGWQFVMRGVICTTECRLEIFLFQIYLAWVIALCRIYSMVELHIWLVSSKNTTFPIVL